ncbi:putative aliphatic sulfonates transport permease protein SsuC [Caloramator mitchellensis]|uniref:Putative aliphatic sulfonates transport permease protein SsuC n=1 Tax=Caloramator mitchellensis TaxID=908809 RepID=A0A0R3JW06_CALMK|nr:ABC transporter permease [Caloramator mitchellensis]KRQ87242.1 putative aliphatic sulfonates transport permease protein SsuC [Caloramator mitchellensis]
MLNKSVNYTKEHENYLRQVKRKKISIIITQILILIIFFSQWEIAARLKILDPFLVSQPSRMLKFMIKLYNQGELFKHIYVTCYETIIGFVFGTLLGTFIAVILWWWDFLSRVLDPYLVVLNALPKIALGPIIIFWVGNGRPAIVIIALMISVIVTIISVHSGFKEVDEDKIKLLKTFGANKFQILRYMVFPSSIPTIISALKINVGLSWVGVIVGEFLVAKEGLGFLIVFGGQVAQLDMVMLSIIILSIAAYVMYILVASIEKRFLGWRN